jgi:iron complex outermembrane receptor protein
VELPAAGTQAAQLNALFDSANATAATNATLRSKGIDVVISHKALVGNG